jgi:hypothetical protein
LQPLILKISFFGRIQIVAEHYANNATLWRESEENTAFCFTENYLV